MRMRSLHVEAVHWESVRKQTQNLPVHRRPVIIRWEVQNASQGMLGATLGQGKHGLVSGCLPSLLVPLSSHV